MPHLLRSLLPLAFLLAPTPALRAQDPPPVTPAATAQDPETTVEALQTRLEATRSDTTLTEEARAAAVEALTKAIENAQAQRTAAATRARYAEQRARVGDDLRAAEQALKALDDARPGPASPDLELAALEQGLAKAQKDLDDAQQRVAELGRERTRRAERRTRIPEQLATLRGQLAAMPPQPPQQPEADARVATARRLQHLTERARLEAEVETLQAELATYDAEVDLLRTQTDVAARRVTVAKADADAWLAVLQPIREREAERAAQAARAEAERAREQDPAVQQLAKENADLAQVAANLASQRAAVERERAERRQELERLEQQFEGIKKRVEQVGADESIGGILRKRRAQLAEFSRRHQERTKSRRGRIVEAQLNEINFEERRLAIVEDPQGWLAEQLGGEDVRAALAPRALEKARELREAQQKLLQQLTDGYRGLVDTELAVETTERELTEQIDAYRKYVTERVLGIRSAQPIWRLDLPALLAAGTWMTDAIAWTNLLTALATAVLAQVWPLAIALPLVVLLGLRRLLRRRLQRHGDAAARGTNVAYTPTALAAIDTVLLAAPVPGLLLLAGWRLFALPDAGDLAHPVANGLVETGLGLGLVLLLRAVVLPKGLAEAHFPWQTTTVAHLRRALPLLLVAVVPFAFGLAALEVHGDDQWLGSLGAALLMAQLVLLAIVAWRLLHPTTGIVGGRFRPTPGVLYRFRRLWFLLGVGTFAALFVMTALGYEYTAQQLTSRVHLTVGVLAGALLLHAMILRGLLLERRRLQIQRAKERLQAAREGDPAGDAGVPPPVELDPQSLAQQTQTLLGGAIVVVVAIGLFRIWVDVLPALGALRQFEVWNIGATEAPQWITLADVLLGVFVLVASLAAARNLPALLELFVLQKLKIQAGERTAITTLARYAIVIVGVVWAFSSVGIGWSKVQWLVAAVSVGLGFGLQEIFANFVSGLILLFERPIRVGDLVQVGQTIGRVTRIQIRATTIQDWNRKELVVPNREFVTKDFVNWTLGDSKVRYVIPVGVAYGSDTKRALEILKQVAQQSRWILKDPEPNAFFVGFGDSALNLELRLFIDIDAVEWVWMSEIHQGIDAAFKAAGISIAFPQRDVHLKLPEQVLERLAGPAPEFGRS